MSLSLYVAEAAVELSAGHQPTALATLPSPTLALGTDGYSEAGDDPGPREFPPNIEEGP